MILHETRTLDYETCKASAMRFTARNEFSRGDSVAYRKCLKMGWLTEFFPERLKPYSFKGKPRAPRRVLDYETCRLSALTATSRKDWDRKDCHAYRKACKMRWIADFFPEKIVRKSEVTLDKCMEAREMLRAQGKNRVSDFIEYNSHLYNMARRNGWVKMLDFQDRLTSMKESGLKLRKYSLEYAIEVVKQYTTLYEFRTGNLALYGWCSKNNHLDKFPWLVSQHTEYTEEMIRETVSRYTDYTTFYKENSAMYGYMCKKKLLHLADSLERRVKFVDGYAVDCIYVYEFPESNHAYVGRTVDLAARNRDHHTRKDDSVVKYAKVNSLEIPAPKILMENITVKEGPAMEQKMMDMYSGLGWKLINSVKGGSLGGMGYQRRWTMDKMMDVAIKYEYWADLEKDYSGLFNAIRKRKIKHMFPWLKKKTCTPGKWKNLSEEEAYEYAKDFQTVTEFSKKYSALSEWARIRGWTKKWFKTCVTAKKRVEQYTLDGKLVAVHESGEEAARYIGIKASWVHHVLRYKPMKGKCGEYLLRYENPENSASEEEIKRMNENKEAYRKEAYVRRKKKQDEHREEYLAERRAKYDSVKAHNYYQKKCDSGFRIRVDPNTGKTRWVFVGLPEQEVAA